MLPFHHRQPLGLAGAEGPWAGGSRWELRFLVAMSSKGWGGDRSVGSLGVANPLAFSTFPQVRELAPPWFLSLPAAPPPNRR